LDRSSKLAPEISNLSLESGVRPGILFGKLVQILAQLLIFPQQRESDERSSDHHKSKQSNHQLSKGHGRPWRARFLVLILERDRARILQFVSKTILVATIPS
jgi:hypothetical protein